MKNDEVLKIKGADSRRVLEGKIAVSGAKNAVLKAMASAFLFDGPIEILNAPDIKDLHWLGDILRKMGFGVDFDGDKIFINPLNPTFKIDDELGKRLRSSVVLMGPTLASLGKVELPYPGGDKIGLRPIDLFLEAFEKMGAKVKEKDDKIILEAGNNLKGAEIFFRRQSVTATESVMMAATLAEGKTVLKNVAMEPEIKHLADWLNVCGAKIKGAGTPFMEIEGGKRLKMTKAFVTPPDRIETASFVALASVLAKDLLIENCNPKELEAVLEYFSYTGVKMEIGKNTIRIKESKSPSEFYMKDFVTHEYPGFPTDAQAPSVAALTQFSGEAIVFESIFNDRFAYVESLRLMGADIVQLDTRNILVRGPRKLKGRKLRSVDIRAGLAYIIAAAVAEGESIIEDVYHIDRGYANIETRLKNVGLDIKRLNI